MPRLDESRGLENVGGVHKSNRSAEELSPRAVIFGLVIGLLLCATNTYFGLQSGWVSMMSLQSSLLGYGLFKALARHPYFQGFTIRENIVLQTTAVATGTLPLAAGLVGVVPALAQLSVKLDGTAPIVLSWSALCAWCFAVAFFGVFLAVPLRRRFIVEEQLVFPSGTATAQIISVLHNVPPPTDGSVRRRREHYRRLAGSDREDNDDDVEDDIGDGRAETHDEAPTKSIDRSSWMALMWSFSASVAFTVLSFAFPVVNAMPLFDIFGHLAHDWLWWFTPSFSYIGQGIIMGLPTTLSMNLGMLCGWAFLSPLAKHMGWAPGPVSSSLDGSRGWILWPALAIMMAESLLSVAIVAFGSIAPALGLSRRQTPVFIDEDEARQRLLDQNTDAAALRAGDRSEEEADTRTVVGGVILSCLACVLLVGIVFGEEGIKWWATIIALMLASIFSILGVRALGETDLNPVSAIGKISQLVFAVVQPHNVVANLIAGGISEAGAQQAGDLMQDLKTGHLHGASPKAQFYGQMIGSLASVFASSGIYVLYRRVYTLPSTNFPVPSAAIWLNLARLVNNGELPPRSREAMLVFGLIFVVIAGLKTATKEQPRLRWARHLPSGIAFAIGFINTPSFSLARLLGGIASYYVQRRHVRRLGPGAVPSSHLENINLIIVASGFVLGEGLASIVSLLAKSAGAGPMSCWGCDLGGGGYCGGC